MRLFAYEVEHKFTARQTRWLMALFAVVSAFAYGCMYSSLTMYLNHGLLKSLSNSVSVYAVFATWLFSASIVGGFWGGRFGHRNAVLIGAVGLIASLFVISVLQNPYVGIALFIIGGGFYVPNYTVVLGQTFSVGDVKRSYAYMLLYMGMNMGVFIGGLFAGYLILWYGFHWMFSVGIISILCAIVFFLYLYQRLPFRDDAHCLAQNSRGFQWGEFIGVCLSILIAIYPLAWLLQHAAVSDWVVFSLYAIVIIFLFSRSFFSTAGFTPEAGSRLRMLIILLLATIVFWALYNLEFSVLMVYFDHGLDRQIGSYIIPTEAFSGFNPVFNMIIGLAFYFLIQRLPWRLGSDFKIYFGVVAMGVGFYILSYASEYQLDAHVLMPLGWMAFGFFFLCFSEILIGPLSFSLASEYGAMPLQGVLLGASQLTAGVAGGLTDVLSRQINFSNIETPAVFNQDFHSATFNYGTLGVVVGVVFILLAYPIRRCVLLDRPKNSQ